MKSDLYHWRQTTQPPSPVAGQQAAVADDRCAASGSSAAVWRRPRPRGERLSLWSNRPLDRGPTTWDPQSVTQATKKLLEEFEALPDQERSELVAELTRRIGLSPHEAPSDDDLVTSADRLFVELDRREQS